jgi:hypothetical protein
MALGDLHVFTGEEYVDTELAPLLNENFNSLKEYMDDASRWQVMPVQFKGTNAKFLIHETTLGTDTTQVLPLVVLDNTDIAKFSACALKVVMSTKNGSTAAVNCDINLQKVHNSNECNVNFNTTNSDDVKAEPCTFTYNNIKYAGLKLTTGNADTLWVSGYTTEEWIAPVVDTSVTNLVTLGSDMNVIPTLFKSLQTDKSPVNDYDVVNKKSLNDLTNIKTYSQLSQIGLSGGVLDNSPYAIGNALPANSMLIVGIGGEGNTYNYPSQAGNLTVVRAHTNHVFYEITTESGNGYAVNYVLQFSIDTASEDTNYVWKRVLTDVDTGYWQPNETVTRDTVRKLVGKQYAGCFLVCKVAGTTGSTQPSPDPADGAGIGGGSGSITFYSSLEEIGITPGQETFASIHSALPINSVLSYYVTPNNFNNSIYPSESYGYVCCSKTSDTTSTSFIFSIQNASKLDVYTRYYNQVYPQDEREWTLLAKQSDLTALSNSVVKTLDNVTPVNNNMNMCNWFHRYPYTDFTNGMTTIEWINKGLFSCYFSESQTFPQKPTDWGQLINIPASSPNSGGSEAFQLFVAQASGDIYYRGTNQDNQLDEVPFKRLTYVGGDWTISKGTNGWARESSTGFTIQWGSTGTLSGTATISFPRTFSTVYQVIPVGNVEETNENRGFPLNERPTTKNFKAAHWYSGQWRYIAVGIS